VPLTTRQIGYGFLGLTLVTLGLTVSMMTGSQHHMDPSHYLMPLVPAAITVAWPFANGWRPWRRATDLSCAKCGTVWLPGESAGACPVCEQGAAA
jgi:hypothetical protein